MLYPNKFDTIVIGAGHAGIESALASSRMGVKTLLITHNIDTIGQISCNPSIGGIGKSHLVKEIDALGGAMAKAADISGIQFRILNLSKGPAVRATRAQIDRLLYKKAINKILENQKQLLILQQSIDDLIINGDKVIGVITNIGVKIYSSTVILTTGTFLNGKIHVGLKEYTGGRAGDCTSIRLSQRLKELNLLQGRLKTGTPPRIDGRTINFSKLKEQYGEINPIPTFSFLSKEKQCPKQISCWLTSTNSKTHDIIRNSLDKSAIYTGLIKGIGPRYCPSIEDKIHRFPSKESHKIFLEPEGLTTYEFYPNGISTSLPLNIQIKLINSIKGLENAHIIRPGYSVEYDYFNPCGLKSSLESKEINCLFFAGQINGTTGYEEAAAQGLLAGINAGLKVLKKNSWNVQRSQAYIGVLVDDLVTKGISEPYRMFTSRAEYRLSLREDNADLRLTEIGKSLNIIDDVRWNRFIYKKNIISKEIKRLELTCAKTIISNLSKKNNFFMKYLNKEYKLSDLLSIPEVNYNNLCEDNINILNNLIPDDIELLTQVKDQIEIYFKYKGYINRQANEILRQSANENLPIPKNFNYSLMSGISCEAKQKLNYINPETIGQASRISGITPATISLLIIHIKRKIKEKK